jgi:hypothetical protein
MAIPITPSARITYDEGNRAVRSWFDTSAEPMDKTPDDPMEHARQTLSESAGLFSWKAGLEDLKDLRLIEADQALSARFIQQYKGLPVDDSEIVVDFTRDGRVYSIYNDYHYAIPDVLDPEQAKVTARRATGVVQQVFRGFEGAKLDKPRRIVYRYQPSDNGPPKSSDPHADLRKDLSAAIGAPGTTGEGGTRPEEGQYFLAWDVTVVTAQPSGNWRVLVDATTAEVINVIDLAQYATGTASVFDPNPTVTTGDITLTESSPIGTLNGQRVPVTLERLDAAMGGVSRLDGQFVHIEEFEAPNFAEPTSATADFTFSSATHRYDPIWRSSCGHATSSPTERRVSKWPRAKS